ncbi:fructokinase [Anseongella ginsenosidimutans]|uniref:Fructokinase n=1 Tax=Anseongella ginsenosidimutans TaxID=496056 RepID=A0A4R3KVS6_9SPHI|nr:carbohydrate kinase [Anseongella ginsenosidimutans]QEC51861.1 carbohydrate kinase [Anseongella ginsenosidimutans]TCS89241.1 fructokinase [Anseongella ginsenosidimutans]
MTNTRKSSPVYCFGEILWDVLPQGALPGGAPFNVACHLSRLNYPCSMISRIGSDPRGRQLQALMETWGVENDLLQTDPTHPTGEVLARMDQHHEMSYEIRFPAAWDFINASPQALEKVREASFFVYGSLAARHIVSRTALFQLLEQAPFRVLDINLRPPFVEKLLLEDLLRHAHVLKTNQHELALIQQLFGGAPAGEDTPAREASQVGFVRERFGIPEIILTKGARGAAYYTPEGSWQTPGTPVQVADTVGSGDSFLAAFIAGHARKEPPALILRKAAAMGAFIAAREGGCPEYQLAEFEKFCQES